MIRKPFLSVLVALFLVLSSILVIDIEMNVIPKVGATVREVGPGKTYSTIQEGVNAAQSGDTVFVYAGIYNETVTINKPLNLTGEDKNLVLLDGIGGGGIHITADSINVSGFTITNASTSIGVGPVSNIRVNDTIMVNNSWGITLSSSHNCHIFENEILNSSDFGIGCYSTTNCRITFNYVHNNKFSGIFLFIGSNNNTLTNNRVGNHTCNGIVISDEVNDNLIANNTVYNNSINGIKMYQGINNTFLNNTVSESEYGIGVEGGRYSEIRDNKLFENIWNLFIWDNCNNLTITDNTIFNGSYGVFIGHSNDTLFSNNEVYNHTNSGMTYETSYRNTLINNTIYNNSENLRFLWNSQDNILINSTLFNSTQEDLVVAEESTLISLNNTFNKSRVDVRNQYSQLTVQWYLHTQVLNPDFTPTLGARVRVEDNDNVSFRETYVTGYDGWKKWIVVTEYIETNTGRTYFTPYNVSAWNRTLSGYADPEPKMEASEYINLQLGEPVFYKKLYKGWNLVSLPLLQNETSPSLVLSSIDGKYDAVYYFNSTDNQWHSYPSGDLTKINSSMGIWIHMTENAVLGINGSNPIKVPIALNSSGDGWNLIGYPTLYDEAIKDALSTIAGKYDSVYAFEVLDREDKWKHNCSYKPEEMNDLRFINSGYGYWVHVIEDCEVDIGPKTPLGSMVAVEDVAVPGKYWVTFQGFVPMIDAELLIYDSFLGQNASQDPLWDNLTLQVGTPGSGLNCTFYDLNKNSILDPEDQFIVEQGDVGDTLAIIYRLTGERICKVTLT